MNVSLDWNSGSLLSPLQPPAQAPATCTLPSPNQHVSSSGTWQRTPDLNIYARNLAVMSNSRCVCSASFLHWMAKMAFVQFEDVYDAKDALHYLVIKQICEHHKGVRKHWVTWKSKTGGMCTALHDIMIMDDIDIEMRMPRSCSFDDNHRRSYCGRNSRLAGRPWWRRGCSDNDRWNWYWDSQRSSTY